MCVGRSAYRDLYIRIDISLNIYTHLFTILRRKSPLRLLDKRTQGGAQSGVVKVLRVCANAQVGVNLHILHTKKAFMCSAKHILIGYTCVFIWFPCRFLIRTRIFICYYVY